MNKLSVEKKGIDNENKIITSTYRIETTKPEWEDHLWPKIKQTSLFAFWQGGFIWDFNTPNKWLQFIH